jgi:hypothetical protein
LCRGNDLARQPRLANAAWPGEGDDTRRRLIEQPQYTPQQVIATDELRHRAVISS